MTVPFSLGRDVNALNGINGLNGPARSCNRDSLPSRMNPLPCPACTVRQRGPSIPPSVPSSCCRAGSFAVVVTAGGCSRSSAAVAVEEADDVDACMRRGRFGGGMCRSGPGNYMMVVMVGYDFPPCLGFGCCDGKRRGLHAPMMPSTVLYLSISSMTKWASSVFITVVM